MRGGKARLEKATGIAMLLREGGAETRKAWSALAPSCGDRQLYEMVGEVVMAVALRAKGRRTVVDEDWLNFGLTRLQIRRLTTTIEKTAVLLEGIRRSRLGNLVWPHDDPLPGQLWKHGQLIKGVGRRLRKVLGSRAVDPVQLAETNLLAYVEMKTGSPHYEKVASVLRTALMCGLWQDGFRRYARSYTAEALKKRVKRFRKRLRSLSKK
jgi:hypothetical protein